MKIILALLLSFYSLTSFATARLYECTPEIGQGEEVINIILDNLNTASLFLGHDAINTVQDTPFTTDGDITEYGEATLTIHINETTKLTLVRDYDETILDISSLDLGLSSKRFMCENIF